MENKQLISLIEEALFNDEFEGNQEIVGITSFQDALVLTNDDGMIIKTNDGSEFHLVIKKVK